MFSFTSWVWPVTCAVCESNATEHLLWQFNTLGHVLVGNIWSWHSWRHYFDTYLNNFADQGHPFIATAFSYARKDLLCSFSSYNASMPHCKTVWEWFKEHNKQVQDDNKVMTNVFFIEAPSCNLDLKDLLLNVLVPDTTAHLLEASTHTVICKDKTQATKK